MDSFVRTARPFCQRRTSPGPSCYNACKKGRLCVKKARRIDHKKAGMGMNGINELLFGLNGEQRAAVTATDGCVRVIAGAGSARPRPGPQVRLPCERDRRACPAFFASPSPTNPQTRCARASAPFPATRGGIHQHFSRFLRHGFAGGWGRRRLPQSFLVLDNSDIDAMLGILYDERGSPCGT